jgi:hypothetical protein
MTLPGRMTYEYARGNREPNMKRFKGLVQNKVIVLENGVHLPEGAQVEVRLPRKRSEQERQQAFERIRRNRINRYIGIDEILEQDKTEREERWMRGGDAKQ